MVSTVTKKFLCRAFCILGIRSPPVLSLQLRAANGLTIPYIGYLELDVALCDKAFPSCGILVVRDPPGASSSVPGILGMNVIRQCYRVLFGKHCLALFNLPSVTQAPDSVVGALQQCHPSKTQHSQYLFGTARVRGARAVRIPGGGGVCSLLPALAPNSPAWLLASPCWGQVVRGMVYILLVNVGMTEVLLYPCTSLGALSSTQVISLPLLRFPLKGPAALC